MKLFRNLFVITALCLVSLQTADAGWFSWNTVKTEAQAQKEKAQAKAKALKEKAKKRFAQAKTALTKIKGKISKKTGYGDEYKLNQKGTLYAELAANPSKVSLYADFASEIYNAVELTDGKHMDIAEVAEAIGHERLADAGYVVLDTFKRWDDASEQFSGALLYNKTENTILIVFAGTASAADGYYDLAFTRAGRDTLKVIANDDYNVHQGFAKGVIDGFGKFRDSFDNIVDQALCQGDVKVITTGHSLGGAMSLIAADWIAREHIAMYNLGRAFIKDCPQIKVQNISFGAPRSFCKTTAKRVEERLGKANVVRFWNKHDVVPAIVSGGLLNAKHVGTPFMLEDSFWRALPGLSHHSMTGYVAKAGKAFKRYLEHAKAREIVEANFKWASEALEKAKVAPAA